MDKIILLDAVNHNLVWGSESWIISAHQNGDNKIHGEVTKLSEFFELNRDKFGNFEGQFPLLVKIIDAKDDLSIQVHPNDEYALKNENSLGKTECWYVLDAEDDADIIVGINSTSKEELQELIDNEQIESQLSIIDVKKGDFFYIPAGCVHAIRKNTKILEVQQSSDITYRLYDYKRPGVDGSLRELHIQDSLNVINYDYKFQHTDFIEKIIDGITVKTFVDNEFFTVQLLECSTNSTFKNEYDFILGVALSELTINGVKINKHHGFIIPNGIDIDIETSGEIYISYIK